MGKGEGLAASTGKRADNAVGNSEAISSIWPRDLDRAPWLAASPGQGQQGALSEARGEEWTGPTHWHLSDP